MSSNFGHGLSALLPYTVLIGSIIIFSVSLFFLLYKKKTMKKAIKATLSVTTGIAGAIALILLALAYAFGSNVQPAANPVSGTMVAPEISLYDFDGNHDLTLGRELTTHADGTIMLTESVFIRLHVPDGAMSNQIYYATSDNETEAHLLFLSEYSSPHINRHDPGILPTGMHFWASERFPNGFRGSIWAVSTDASGAEYRSNVVSAIWDPTKMGSADGAEMRWALPPMVFVNDKIYQIYSPDIVSIPDETWVYIGDILSTVPGYESPTQNFQTNMDMPGAEIYHSYAGRIHITNTTWGDPLDDEVFGDSIIVGFEGNRYMFISEDARDEVYMISDDVVRSSLMIDGYIYSLMGSFSGGSSHLGSNHVFLGEVTDAVPLNEYPTEHLQANREIVVGMKVYREPPGDVDSVLVFQTAGYYYRYSLLPGAMKI
jgi:hypothetical protein